MIAGACMGGYNMEEARRSVGCTRMAQTSLQIWRFRRKDVGRPLCYLYDDNGQLGLGAINTACIPMMTLCMTCPQESDRPLLRDWHRQWTWYNTALQRLPEDCVSWETFVWLEPSGTFEGCLQIAVRSVGNLAITESPEIYSLVSCPGRAVGGDSERSKQDGI